MTYGGCLKYTFYVVESPLPSPPGVEVAAQLLQAGDDIVIVVDPDRDSKLADAARLLVSDCTLLSLPTESAGLLAEILAWLKAPGRDERPQDGAGNLQDRGQEEDPRP